MRGKKFKKSFTNLQAREQLERRSQHCCYCDTVVKSNCHRVNRRRIACRERKTQRCTMNTDDSSGLRHVHIYAHKYYLDTFGMHPVLPKIHLLLCLPTFRGLRWKNRAIQFVCDICLRGRQEGSYPRCTQRHPRFPPVSQGQRQSDYLRLPAPGTVDLSNRRTRKCRSRSGSPFR